MEKILLKQYDLDDFKSIFEEQREKIRGDVEELLNSSPQAPALVSRSKLIKILDCSASWLSKVTSSGELPSIPIGGRVFYDLNNISKMNIPDKIKIRRSKQSKQSKRRKRDCA